MEWKSLSLIIRSISMLPRIKGNFKYGLNISVYKS